MMQTAIQTKETVRRKAVVAVLFGVLGAVLMGITVVNTVTSSNLGSSSISLANQTFSNESAVTIIPQSIGKASGNASAIGDTLGTAVEGAAPYGTARTALVKRNYSYRFDMQEASVASWQSGDQFKVDVYMDDGSTNSLIGTLYVEQVALVDDLSIEGVSIEMDTGLKTALGDTFSIIITRQ